MANYDYETAIELINKEKPTIPLLMQQAKALKGIDNNAEALRVIRQVITADSTNQQAHIEAVELDPDAAAQARENVAESPWPQRIMVHHADVRTWETNALYDLVLCNPPFYKGHIPSSEAHTAMAKHDGMLSLAALLSTMARLTVAEARISMIVPADRLAELEKVAATEGFSLSRICEVSYRLGKPPKRVLIELSRGNHAPVLEELTVETGTGKPTPEFRALLSDLELDF